MDHHDDYHYAENYPLRALEDDCRLLGDLLDDCLKKEIGEELFEKMGRIRTLSHCAAQLSAANDKVGSRQLAQRMTEELFALPLEEALPILRAFGHYLSLTSIAELHHSVRTTRMDGVPTKTCDELFAQLIEQGVSQEELYEAVCKQHVEIVLTAHPTQVNRRTLQYKFTRIEQLLAMNDRADLNNDEKQRVIEDMVREITALWQTDELRRKKPTPLDEARGGLHIVEQSLWASVPEHLRRLSAALRTHTGRDLPLHATPIRFSSWMGGDRDGNPNVTAKTTFDVACLARWMAADLYIKEMDSLRFELSMNHASDQVWSMARDIVRRQHAEQQHGQQGAGEGPAPIRTTAAADGGSGANPKDMEKVLAKEHSFHVNPEQLAQLIAGSSPTKSAAEGGAEDCDDDRMYDPRQPRTYCVRSDDEEGGPEMLGAGSGASPRWNVQSPRSPSNKIAHPFASSASLANLAGDGDGPEGGSPLPAVDSRGQLVPEVSAKRLPGSKGANRRMTSIDALLHPRSGGATPYRIVLGEVRHKLVNTRRRMEDLLQGLVTDDDADWYETEEPLLQTLLACHNSLWECGGGVIAEGKLLDMIRRVHVFGVSLMKMDLRQESTRHSDALDEVTQYLGLGSYNEWEEDQRLAWLEEELSGKRPLIPPSMPFTPDSQEVFDTLKVAAELGTTCLGAYVISMATRASDVLAVELLQQEARLQVQGEDRGGKTKRVLSPPLRVAPLFETLTDLDSAGPIMTRLFKMRWYRDHVRNVHGNHQEVMLGYSDSGKDAGRLAAAWALYRCQETLVKICDSFDVRLTLFHGRGGTVGRGGGPMLLAIQSQPPGSVQGSLRITEQGEMVQAKFGNPEMARRQLEIFAEAVLLATLRPPQPPKCDSWRELMDSMSAISCKAYRGVVFEHPNFISYFRAATPEEELGNLNIGSRPSRRKAGGGVQTLRAIPWIFAWTQTRMVLPAWLGVADALMAAVRDGKKGLLRDMYQQWPFFQSVIDLIEMVLAKADMRIAAIYDEALVKDPQERALGEALRRKYIETVSAVLAITGHHRLSDNNSTLRHLISMRNPHMDPINVLQVEILRRLRLDPDNRYLRDALLLTINGIAAGMRNTG